MDTKNFRNFSAEKIFKKSENLVQKINFVQKIRLSKKLGMNMKLVGEQFFEQTDLTLQKYLVIL